MSDELYPNHKILRDNEQAHETLCDFLEWLSYQPESIGIVQYYDDGGPIRGFSNAVEEDLIARYFGIDKVAFEDEKNKIIETLQAMNS